MNKTIKALRDYWSGLGIINPKGATESELKAFEMRYGVVLTPFLREYFESVNGTKNGKGNMEDEELTSFWHLDQIETFSKWSGGSESTGEQYFAFADHSVHIRCWAVRLSSEKAGQNPVIISDTPLEPLASSFEEYLKRYIAREWEVLYPAQ